MIEMVLERGEAGEKIASLQELLEKNCEGRLSEDDSGQITALLGNPAYRKSNCVLCEIYRNHEDHEHDVRPAVHDTRLCAGHLRYALEKQIAV